MEHDKFLVLSNYSKYIYEDDVWVKQSQPTMFKLSSIIRADAKGDQTVLYTETGEFNIELDFHTFTQFLRNEVHLFRPIVMQVPNKE